MWRSLMAAWSWAVVCLAGWAEATPARMSAMERRIVVRMACSGLRGAWSKFLLAGGRVVARRGRGDCQFGKWDRFADRRMNHRIWDILGHFGTLDVVVSGDSGFVLRRRARMWRGVAPCGARRGDGRGGGFVLRILLSRSKR